MGLLQNIRILNAQPIKHGAGGTAGSVPVASCVDRGHYNQAELAQNMCFGSAYIDPKGGFPYGYAPPYQIKMPIKEGGMSTSRTRGYGYATLELKKGVALQATIVGAGSVVPGLSALAYLAASIAGAGNITPNPSLGATSALAATITGSGQIDSFSPAFTSAFTASISGAGDMTGDAVELIVALAADLAGAGDLTGSIGILSSLSASIAGSGTISEADLRTYAELSASLAGGGSITAAQMSALAHLAATLTGEGEASASMRLDCFMTATITSAGDLVTAQSCAQAVWSALSSVFNDPGTMGSKMNSASAAGDPWTAELPGVYQPGSAGYKLANVEVDVWSHEE
jgi:hypothetical protein